MKLLVTGGAGFIGSNFILHWMKNHPDDQIVNLDALTYAGNLENLQSLKDNKNYSFIKGRIEDAEVVRKAMEGADVVVHFAAESFVDRSITGPQVFVTTNILGSQVLFDVARELKIERFINISTDEVYGSLGAEGFFTEDSPYAPNNPYSACKAGADLLARSYFKTFDFPVITTHASNNYGALQFPEKLIPLFLIHCMQDKSLPLYGSGTNVRDWLHVEDHCRGIELAIQKGKEGETYNFGGNCERTNLEIARLILEVTGKPESLISYVKDRPGHDLRYAIDSTKSEKELGFRADRQIEDLMPEIFQWYKNNQGWWERIMSGEYTDFYNEWYGERGM